MIIREVIIMATPRKDYSNNIFGERLKMLRGVMDKTQREFSEMLGISQPAFSGYESGRIYPTLEIALDIAKKCGVSLDWLFGIDSYTSIKSMGDVAACFMDLFVANEVSVEYSVHKNDIEEKDTPDEERNYVNLKIYNREKLRNPDIKLNGELCDVIGKSYELARDLHRYERDQEGYESEKKKLIEKMSIEPVTKVNHSHISEDERREKMREIILKEVADDEKPD